MQILRQLVPQWKVPVVGRVSGSPPDPFKVLISCILSLRTQDRTTNQAAGRLFQLADHPQSMLRLTCQQIEKAIYPVGFYLPLLDLNLFYLGFSWLILGKSYFRSYTLIVGFNSI